MSQPLSEDLRTAAEWLDVNEGTDGESDSRKRVADWLRRKAGNLEYEATVRRVAKETGKSPQKVRAAIEAAEISRKYA